MLSLFTGEVMVALITSVSDVIRSVDFDLVKSHTDTQKALYVLG